MIVGSDTLVLNRSCRFNSVLPNVYGAGELNGGKCFILCHGKWMHNSLKKKEKILAVWKSGIKEN